MRVCRSFSVVTAILVCGLAGAGARVSAQQPPQNLKVLPKDIARPALTTLMRGYVQALGAENCAFCHTEDMAQRASDDNPRKDIARKMIQMTMDLNTQLDAIGKPAAPDAPKVTCFTCHRGAAKPATAAGGH
jgi:mono/diheme cytochrome c family protein